MSFPLSQKPQKEGPPGRLPLPRHDERHRSRRWRRRQHDDGCFSGLDQVQLLTSYALDVLDPLEKGIPLLHQSLVPLLKDGDVLSESPLLLLETIGLYGPGGGGQGEVDNNGQAQEEHRLSEREANQGPPLSSSAALYSKPVMKAS